MPKTKISQYDSTSAGANLNTDIAGIDINEGCAPSGINNAIRTLMAQIRDLQSGVSGDTIPVAAGGTGSTTASGARSNLSAAARGANSDITSITGLTTPLAVAQGGTGSTSTTFVNATTNITGTLPIANGGTNNGSLAVTAGGVVYTDGTKLVNVGAGTTGQTLTSNGAGAPSWSSSSSGGGATTTSSAVDITLTSSSNKVQDVTMTADDKAVILPDATTLTTGNSIFVINNRGGRAFYVENTSGIILAVVKPFASVQLSLTSNATANGTWAKQDGDIFFGQYVPSVVTTDISKLITLYAFNSANTFCNNNNGYVSVKKISSTTALILWSPQDVTGNALQNLKAVVATVSAGVITYGTAVTVYTGTTSGLSNFGAVVLSSTAAFVIVEKNNTTASVVYPLVLSGNSITVGTVSAGFASTSGGGRTADICYLSATTAMISYVSTVNTTLQARVVTHNGSSAPTLSTAVSLTATANSPTNRLIPLTSTTCQWLYLASNALKTLIITSNGSASAPTLGTAITTSLVGYGQQEYLDTLNSVLAYPYSATETACFTSPNNQMSFTISGTTITEQSYSNLMNSSNGFNVNGLATGSIAWFNSTQGAFLRTNSAYASEAVSQIIPVSYTAGLGLSIGDANITTPTINGYAYGAIDALDSTTAIAVIPYAKGIQAEIVTLL
jgi:hypothetical protein